MKCYGNYNPRFGMVLYDSEGKYLHGLHEVDSGLDRPWGLSNYESNLAMNEMLCKMHNPFSRWPGCSL